MCLNVCIIGTMWSKRNRNLRTLANAVIILFILSIVGFASLKASEALPRGERLLTNVMAAKALFIDGVNPYSPLAEQLRDIYAQVSKVPQATNLRFNEPVFSLFLDLPYLLINDFSVIRTIWFGISVFMLIAIVFLVVNMLNWRITTFRWIGLLAFALIWSHSALATMIGMKTIFTTLIISTFFNAVKERHYEWAGVLLGLTAIQPYITVALGLFVLIWAIRARHMKVILWQFITLVFLWGIAALIRPQWLVDYIRVLFSTDSGFFTLSHLVRSLLPAAGVRVSIILSVIAGFTLILEWVLTSPRSFDRFLWAGNLTLALTPFLGGLTEPSSYLVLIPAIIFSLKLLSERWPVKGNWFGALFLLIFLVAGWMFLLPKMDQALVEMKSLFFFTPIMVTIMLYWVRWWATDKPRVWYDTAMGSGH